MATAIWLLWLSGGAHCDLALVLEVARRSRKEEERSSDKSNSLQPSPGKERLGSILNAPFLKISVANWIVSRNFAVRRLSFLAKGRFEYTCARRRLYEGQYAQGHFSGKGKMVCDTGESV